MAVMFILTMTSVALRMGRNGYVDDRDIEGLTELCDCAHHSCNIRSHVADRVVMKIEDGVSDSVVADTLQPSLLYTSLLS